MVECLNRIQRLHEKGRYAELIAVDGDPLSDVKTLQHAKFVMKGERSHATIS
jgi:imidazolonepropionase-like amidohydrolase